MYKNSDGIRSWVKTLGGQSGHGQDIDERVVLCEQGYSKLKITRTIWETKH
jgi:hypothetical protein